MIKINSKKSKNLLIFTDSDSTLLIPDEIKTLIEKAKINLSTSKTELITPLDDNGYEKIFLINIDDIKNFKTDVLEKKVGEFIRNVRDQISSLDIQNNLPENYCFNLSYAVECALFHYKGIKKEPENLKLQTVNILSKNRKNIENGYKLASCANFARTLINTPSNYITPKEFTDELTKFSVKNKLTIETIKGKELEKRKFGGIYAVGKGSENVPYFNIVSYQGDKNSKDYTALVGKGVTFDSGGISIKPSNNMKDMINDMGGAAIVFGLLKYVVEAKLPVNIKAFLPLAENMPSSTAYKPGDVITMHNGLTVDIVSTDAEGRMLLADAISYANKLGAKEIIELSTLTGSTVNFVGHHVTGYYCLDDALSERLETASTAVCDKIWRYPTFSLYKDLLKSTSADLINASSGCGGITAGVFLNEFAGDTPFAHFDIAGTVVADKPNGIYEKGATAAIIKTIAALLA